jgi:hypothetical protein
MRLVAVGLAALVFAGAAEARTWRIRPGENAEQNLQTAFVEAEAGDTIQIARGRY